MTSHETSGSEQWHVGSELTHLLVVDDVERAKAFDAEVLGAEGHRDTAAPRSSSASSGRGFCS